MMNEKIAIYNDLKINRNKSPTNLYLEQCDVCGSSNIAETREGYVCRECGIVLEIQRLEYHIPYENTRIQHEILNKTQMGFWKERCTMSNSVHMERLNKLDSIKENEKLIEQTAKVEIKRLLTGLHFPLQDAMIILKKFLEIRKQLGKGTKYRTPEKLVPCVIYFHYKVNGKPIREHELLELTPLTKKEFNNFKLQLLEMWPNYQERNRQEYILQRVLGLCEYFGLGMNFYHQTKKILFRFYESIKNTKDDVIVGLVSSIALLCSGNEDIRVNNLCDRLNIKMSTIQMQVERRIFRRFRIDGYISLIRSKDILKRIMIKLGVLDPSLVEFDLENEGKKKRINPEELYQLVHLGTAHPIFTLYDNEDYYTLLVETNKAFLVSLIEKLRPYNFSNVYKNKSKRNVEKHNQNSAIRVELWKFQYPTGPPLIIT